MAVVNATVKIRAISEATLSELLALIEADCHSLKVETFPTIELPIPPKKRVADTQANKLHRDRIADATDPELPNYGVVPCPICGAVDDQPCRFTRTGVNHEPKGSARKNPHPQRSEANVQSANTHWVCVAGDFETTDSAEKALHQFGGWPEHQMKPKP